jgi:hypothetical protein
MKTVTLKTIQGSQWSTNINGTNEEIIEYFMGKWFNLGTVEDKMERVCFVLIS